MAEASITPTSENCTYNPPRQNCSFANFVGQQYSGVVIIESDLKNSSFEELVLDYPIVSESNLTVSSFRGASLKGALFVRTDLSGVDFTCADLQGAIFDQSKIAGAIGIPEGLRILMNPRCSLEEIYV